MGLSSFLRPVFSPVQGVMGTAAGLGMGIMSPILGAFGMGPRQPGLPELTPFTPSPAQGRWWMSGAGMSQALALRDEDRQQEGYLGRRHALNLPPTALGQDFRI